MDRYINDKFKEECGVVGIFSSDTSSISIKTYYALIALQHRGQESCGITVLRNNKLYQHKEMGLVREVFNNENLKLLNGNISIGHVRYSTAGESNLANTQPFITEHNGNTFAIAHNGNITNSDIIKNNFKKEGATFTTTSDTEVIAKLIAKNYKHDYVNALLDSLPIIKGAFSLVLICDEKLIGIRDPNGIRPLCIGQIEDGYILASESCALDVIGAKFIRNIEKGEIVIIDSNGINSIIYNDYSKKSICSFEFVYFARPDSNIDGKNVYMSRREAGRILAREHPIEADMVIAVPDSGLDAAIGYAQEADIPFGMGLIKNKYLGRSFIQPSQKLREQMVKLKLNVLTENIENKRLVLIDDSIVRGTTSKYIVELLKKQGAKEVHLRISSPPVSHSCYFGIDTPSNEYLISSIYKKSELCKILGADSIGYLSFEGLAKSIGVEPNCLCMGCFNQKYPLDLNFIKECILIENA